MSVRVLFGPMSQRFNELNYKNVIGLNKPHLIRPFLWQVYGHITFYFPSVFVAFKYLSEAETQIRNLSFL